MDWPNERYVRFYTRRTADDLMLRWEARMLWPHILAIADRAGLIRIHHQGERRMKALALLLDAPLDLVLLAMPELLEDGRIREVDEGYVIPNYIEAQEARSSDSSRQRKRRERRRDQALAGPVTKRDDVSRNVTAGHGALPDVTSGHAASHRVTPSRTVPSRTVLTPLPPKSSALRVVPPPTAVPGGGKEEAAEPTQLPLAMLTAITPARAAPPSDADLEAGEVPPTRDEWQEDWDEQRAASRLPLERIAWTAKADRYRLKLSRERWRGTFFRYLDPELSKGLSAAQRGWPIADLLTPGVFARKVAPRPPPPVFCGRCGELAEDRGGWAPDAEGRPVCYQCHADRFRELEAGGGA